ARPTQSRCLCQLEFAVDPRRQAGNQDNSYRYRDNAGSSRDWYHRQLGAARWKYQGSHHIYDPVEGNETGTAYGGDSEDIACPNTLGRNRTRASNSFQGVRGCRACSKETPSIPRSTRSKP